MRDEQLRESRFGVDDVHNVRLGDPGDLAVHESCRRRHPVRLAVEAPFSEKAAGFHKRDDRLFALIGGDRDPRFAALHVEDRVGWVALTVDTLLLAIRRDAPAAGYVRQKDLRIERWHSSTFSLSTGVAQTPARVCRSRSLAKVTGCFSRGWSVLLRRAAGIRASFSHHHPTPRRW